MEKKIRLLNTENTHLKVSSIVKEMQMPVVKHIVYISVYTYVNVSVS